MKKIKFNYRDYTGGYDENHNPITKLKETTGYYFKIDDYHFVVHKYIFDSGYCGGWRVTELTSGGGVTILRPTRRKALEYLERMQQRKWNGFDFFTKLKQQVDEIIRLYGVANDPATLD